MDSSIEHLFTTTTRIEKLDVAESLLELIMSTFNDAVETCESCGTEHKVDWDGYLAREAAKAAITRIHRIRGLLAKEDSDAVSDSDISG